MAVSEFRRDLVSNDWVAIAMGRAKRPHAFVRANNHDTAYTKRQGCPFENLQASGNAPPIIVRSRSGSALAEDERDRWFVRVIPNKYPAFLPGARKMQRRGLFEVMSGVGYHELVITRDHDRHWGHYTSREAAAVMGTYLDRYRSLVEEPFVEYVSIFHNFGRSAGASVYHPHSQIIAIPVVPPDVQRSFDGASVYFKKTKRCVHCDMLKWEMRERTRLVAENDAFVAYCPFASRTAFEVRIFPKRHTACLDAVTPEETIACGDILRKTLRAIRQRLRDPSYNFFIHTSTGQGMCRYPHYHWHIEILPKVGVWAGFEIATGIEISAIAPEQAAAFLRQRS